MAGETCFPTTAEHQQAIRDIEQGEFAGAERYYTKLRDCYLEKASKPFDRARFIAGLQARGEPVDEGLVQRTRALLESWKAEDRAKAAEAASFLGGLSAMHLNYEKAAEHFRQAVELDPRNPKYQVGLAEMEATLKD